MGDIADIEEIEINGEVIRLGQLLKFSGIAESGAQAGQIIAAGDVSVDGELETRRGRQLIRGATVEVRLPGATRRLRVA